MLWPDLPCTADLVCSPGFLGGDPTVANGATTTANVALLVPGSISGSVVSAAGGAPIADAVLRVRQDGPTFVQETSSLATGSYTFTGLIAGTYTLEIVDAPGHVREAYNDIPCLPNCGSGTQIAVVAGTDTPAIDFVLDQAASIGGVIRDLGETGLRYTNGVQLARIDAGAASHWAGAVVLSGEGGFRFDALPPGEYRLSTSSLVGVGAPAYRQEVYDDATCAALDCTQPEILAGLPILLAGGEARTGIDLALDPMGSLQGCVAGGGGPLANVTVTAYRMENLVFLGTVYVYLGSATTGADGCYTITHLLPGTTRPLNLHTSNTLGYRDQVYVGQECGVSCPLLTGFGIPLGFDADATGFDFQLHSGPRLHGALRDAITLGGVPNLRVQLFVPSGAQVRQQDALMLSAGNGAWSSVVLDPGIYFMQVEVLEGPYRGRHLLGGGSCFPDLGELCPAPTTGTPVQLNGDIDVTGVDLLLRRQDPIQADGFE